MAESNATQVILTDDGVKIIKAQNTADNATSGVTNLNDPNLMSVIEKQTAVSQYAGLTSQYNVVLARAKEANVSTDTLTTAYTNLNTFMGSVLADTTVASDVNRDTYKSLTDAYNAALSNVQTALNNSFNTDISNMQTNVSVASQAASSAAIVASQAAITGYNASQAAEQASMAADQAKSAGDNAISVANNASQAASGAVIAGSQAAAKADKASTAASQAQIAGDNATSVANNASQAASGAVIAGSQAASIASQSFVQAQSAVDYVNSETAVQSVAIDKAQSAASDAVSKAESTASEFGKVDQKADSAFDNAMSAQSAASDAVEQASSAATDSKDAKQIAGAVSQSYKTLTDGSTMTIAELESGLAVKLTKTDLDGYATQDWTQNQVKMTADGINGTISSIKNTVDGQTTSINDLKADSSSFKSQFTTVNDTLDKQSTDIGTLQASSKELSSNFSSLSTDNNTNKNDISQLKQTATEVSSTLETVQTQVQNSAVGTNLIVQSNLKNGYLDPSTGGVQSSSIDFNSDYIATNGETVFTFSSPDYVFKGNGADDRIAMYDSNKNYLGYQPITSATQTLSKSNVAYIRFSINFNDEGGTSGSVSDWLDAHRYKLEKGSVATDWCLNPADTATVTAVSTISQTVDGMKSDISKKIEQKDLNGYATQDWAQNQIKTTADGINGTISSIKGTVDSHNTSINELKADSSSFKAQFTTVNGTLSTQSTDISTLQASSKSLSANFDSLSSDNKTNQHDIGQLQASAKEFNNTLTTVQTQVQNSAVGTNLLLKTGTPFSMTGNNTVNQCGYAYSLANGYNVASLASALGTQFTISFDWSVSGDSPSGGFVPQWNTTPWGIGLPKIAVSSSNASGHVSYTFSESTDNSNIGNMMGFRLDNFVGTLTISNIKLEKGSVATDYSVNPSDTATQSQISQLSSDINLRVTKGNLIDQINIQAGNTLVSSSGQLTLSGKSVFLDSVDPVIMKSANIADLAVGTAQIGDGAITNAKIGKLAVGTAQIANGAITNAQIGNAAIDTANIKDAAISSAKIANLAVGTAQIGDGAITNAKIGKLAVGTAQIANAAITDAQVGNVSANKLTAGTIDFNTITGKNINASSITTGTLDTNRLNVGQLSALSADLGNVTAGSLKGVNIVASTFSTPNGSFTTEENGAITAKNMTLIGGTLTSPTINASTINGSTINGTTFNAGNKLNRYGNTSYPLTINQDGSVISTSFQSVANENAALRTVLKNGTVQTNLRGMTQFATGMYSAADVALGSGQLALFEGYTTSQDPNFTATGIKPTGYVILDAGTGLNLHGDNQKIHFHGMSVDSEPKGITFTPYGNINGDEGSTTGNWYVGYNLANMTAQFGIDNLNKNTIELYRPTFVDEIGALGNRLDSGRLLLHDVAGTAQMYLLNDGSPAFVSPTIYNRTYSYGANMYVTSQGRVGRSTSASKYKLAITRSDDTTQADRLMTLNPASWNDKVATEKMAKSLSNGEIPVESEINLKRHYGLIAEDLRDAGLDEFLITGKDGQIEGIEYDRLWTVLIPKIKQLNNRVNELERKTL